MSRRRGSSLNKTDLIELVAKRAEQSKADAGRAVEAVFDSISAALRRGDKVALVGFGTFLVRSRPPRKGRNPHTGAAVQIKAGKSPGFKAGKALREAVN